MDGLVAEVLEHGCVLGDFDHLTGPDQIRAHGPPHLAQPRRNLHACPARSCLPLVLNAFLAVSLQCGSGSSICFSQADSLHVPSGSPTTLLDTG